jgi:hypothetical protein
MAIFIPGRPLDLSICSLCDDTAIGIIIVLMMITDKMPDKVIQSEVQMAVCEKHWISMPISIDKTKKKPENRIITF